MVDNCPEFRSAFFEYGWPCMMPSRTDLERWLGTLFYLKSGVELYGQETITARASKEGCREATFVGELERKSGGHAISELRLAGGGETTFEL